MLSNKIYKTVFSVLYYWGIVSRYDLMKETARLLDINDIDDEFIHIFIEIINNMEPYIESDVIGRKTYYSILAEDVGAVVLSSQWQNADYPPIEKDMIPEEDEDG